MQVQKGNSVEFKCIIRFYIILVHLINQCNLQTGTTSKWEMDSVCFYHGPHELVIKLQIMTEESLSQVVQEQTRDMLHYFFQRLS